MYSRKTFAKQFKSLMEAKGFTQRMVAEQIGTTEVTISRYATGDRVPNIETVVELARVLGVSVDLLLNYDPPAAPRTAPDVNILVSCYQSASFDDRSVLWALLDRYMTVEQRLIISSVQASEKEKAV